jgi:hypothetical protein
MGYGDINPVKRWWADLEVVAGKVVKPRMVNRRGLDLKKGFALKDNQKIAYTNADILPPPDFRAPFPADRKAGIAAGQLLETPAQARERRKNGGPKPVHYNATPPIAAAEAETNPATRKNCNLDPWGNHIQIVEYGDLQFTKAPEVLRAMGLTRLQKSEEALRQLAAKAGCDRACCRWRLAIRNSW